MNRDELREKVARAMWMADVEPYDPADRIPLEDAMESARAYVYAEADAAIDIVLEEAARVADAMPLSHNAAETALEITAAIRALASGRTAS